MNIVECFFHCYQFSKKGSPGSLTRLSGIHFAIQDTMIRLNIDFDQVVMALSRHFGINDRERELWIDNDENLFRQWQTSKMSKKEFISQYRNDISKLILWKAHL